MNWKSSSHKDITEDFTSDTAELELERYKNARRGMTKFRKALLTKKAREGNVFSAAQAALMMIEVGKEADRAHRPHMKSGSKKMLERLRSSLRSKHDIHTPNENNHDNSESNHDNQRRSSLTLATTISLSSEKSESNKPEFQRRRSRRKSFTSFLRKRLSFMKKLPRQNSM